VLEGDFILQKQKTLLLLSCHGLSYFQNGFVLPPSFLHNWCGASEKGTRKIQHHGSFVSEVGYIPTLFPCLRDEAGHGARSGGCSCAWAEYDTVRTRAQCL